MTKEEATKKYYDLVEQCKIEDLEQRKLTTVENDYVERLVSVALRVDSFDETVRCKVTNTEASTF